MDRRSIPFVVEDAADRSTAQSHVLGQLFLGIKPARCPQLSDAVSRVVCQDRVGVGFPSKHSPVVFFVLVVLFWGIPAKVVEPVVGAVSVGEMSALHAWRAWADERQQHDLVNVETLHPSFMAKGHSLISAVGPRFEPFPLIASQRPHMPVVPNPVTGEPKEREAFVRCFHAGCFTISTGKMVGQKGGGI